MTKTAKELRRELAKAEEEEKKKSNGFELVVENEDGDLSEIVVNFREQTEEDSDVLIEQSKKLANEYEKIDTERLEVELKEGKMGAWLKIHAIFSPVINVIMTQFFDLEDVKVASLPNVELLNAIFNKNEWLDSSATQLTKEISYLSAKQNNQ